MLLYVAVFGGIGAFIGDIFSHAKAGFYIGVAIGGAYSLVALHRLDKMAKAAEKKQ